MNKLGLWSGTSETPLSIEGIKQAQVAGRQAKSLNIDYIVCSPLGRALKTARIVAKEIGYPKAKIHVNKLFIERHWGELEGTKWSQELDLDNVTEIETRDAILERARLALEFLNSLEADNVLVVSHGSFGRALRHHYAGIPYTNQRPPNEPVLPNGKILQWL